MCIKLEAFNKIIVRVIVHIIVKLFHLLEEICKLINNMKNIVNCFKYIRKPMLLVFFSGCDGIQQQAVSNNTGETDIVLEKYAANSHKGYARYAVEIEKSKKLQLTPNLEQKEKMP